MLEKILELFQRENIILEKGEATEILDKARKGEKVYIVSFWNCQYTNKQVCRVDELKLIETEYIEEEDYYVVEINFYEDIELHREEIDELLEQDNYYINEYEF